VVLGTEAELTDEEPEPTFADVLPYQSTFTRKKPLSPMDQSGNGLAVGLSAPRNTAGLSTPCAPHHSKPPSARTGSDYLHLGTAGGTAERVRFVNLRDERRPAFAGLPRRGWSGRSGGARRRRLPLSPLAARLVRVPAVVPDQVFVRIWYALGARGQQVEGIGDLEAAGRPGQKFAVARFGKATDGVVLRFLDQQSHCHGLIELQAGA